MRSFTSTVRAANGATSSESIRAGKPAMATSAIVGSYAAWPEHGPDAGKLIYERSRHALVDTIGLLLLVIIH
jgi:hypothetical protein